MTITKTQEGTSLIVAVEGRLDTNTSPELEAELEQSLNGIEALTLDLAELEYISSAGLRVLLASHKRMLQQGGALTVTNPGDIVKEIFDVTGFSEILTIE